MVDIPPISYALMTDEHCHFLLHVMYSYWSELQPVYLFLYRRLCMHVTAECMGVGYNDEYCQLALFLAQIVPLTASQ